MPPRPRDLPTIRGAVRLHHVRFSSNFPLFLADARRFPATSLRMALLLYGGMALLAVGLAWILPKGLTIFRLPPAPLPWLTGLLAGLLLVLLSALLERLWPRFAQLGQTLTDLLGPISLPRALLLGLLSGVAEEMLFRGPLQEFLGPLLATLVFAGLHGMGNRHLWPWPLFALGAGGFFAGLTAHFDTLWPAAVAHVVVNALNLRRLGARYR